ncbi:MULTISPECIES: polymer-forming cytoskeletal protein [Microbulbifer]|uniref:bactofilin family protein n=1 Tax=Microbulbifer TaxID=48073 RepID=UPI0009907EB6|nr:MULTISPECIES: polymer-forming cytoskeletal protein [Microbulbifer]QKX17183.1 polymer-forming cytoskeletal protein [Microbulbifer sp. YPW1]
MANPLDPKPDANLDSNSFLSGMNENGASERPFADKLESTMAKDRSVIGKNIKFRGELIGTEDLHIEGTIEGTVIMEGHDLSIGREGEINANIHAQNIVINGTLTGDALADELIEIRNTAVVKGNLIAPRIQLDDGGKFRGSMDMVDTDDEMKARHSEFKEKLVHPNLPPKDEAPARAAAAKKSFAPKDSAKDAAKEVESADS